MLYHSGFLMFSANQISRPSYYINCRRSACRLFRDRRKLRHFQSYWTAYIDSRRTSRRHFSASGTSSRPCRSVIRQTLRPGTRSPSTRSHFSSFYLTSVYCRPAVSINTRHRRRDTRRDHRGNEHAGSPRKDAFEEGRTRNCDS